MVRLKDVLSMNVDAAKQCFNSTMVRLKANISTLLKGAHSSFNSTMVRLKARNIKSGAKMRMVSIPQWFD